MLNKPRRSPKVAIAVDPTTPSIQPSVTSKEPIAVVSDTGKPIRSPLRHIDPVTTGAAAIMETRNREVHLPPVTAYRWWARRTEAINGAILDALALDEPGRHLVVDPFAGGGIIPLAAALRGHQVYAQDLNPWAATGLAGMLDLPNATQIVAARERLGDLMRGTLRAAYATTFSDGSEAQVSHTLRVATAHCLSCGSQMRLFPHALVSLVVRRERGLPEAFLACPAGHVFGGVESEKPQECPKCARPTDSSANYTERRVKRCHECAGEMRLETLSSHGGWEWDVALVERVSGRQRELAIPTAAEVVMADNPTWQPSLDLGEIPAGAETKVLLRHGFTSWNDIYPRRQRFVFEQLLAHVDAAATDSATRRAFRLAIYGAAEMAGHLSRWDRFYLKSYEAMAGHRFNFTTLAAEPNVWGTAASGRGTVTRRLTSFAKAVDWMHERGIGALDLEGPLSADSGPLAMGAHDVRVVEGSSENIVLPDDSADIVLTDPPYHDDVQYGELSLPLRAWAQLSTDDLVGEASVKPANGARNPYDEYQALLVSIFQESHRVLRPGGHLIFSYANRDPRAWEALFGALQGAGLRAVGFTVLPSENETDVVKRDVRACTYDFVMDLVTAETTQVEQWSPPAMPAGYEGDFLDEVGKAFLRIGHLSPSDLRQMRQNLAASDFLLAPAKLATILDQVGA